MPRVQSAVHSREFAGTSVNEVITDMAGRTFVIAKCNIELEMADSPVSIVLRQLGGSQEQKVCSFMQRSRAEMLVLFLLSGRNLSLFATKLQDRLGKGDAETASRGRAILCAKLPRKYDKGNYKCSVIQLAAQRRINTNVKYGLKTAFIMLNEV